MAEHIVLAGGEAGDACLAHEMFRNEDYSPRLIQVSKREKSFARPSVEPFDATLLGLNLPDSQGLDTVWCMLQIIIGRHISPAPAFGGNNGLLFLKSAAAALMEGRSMFIVRIWETMWRFGMRLS